MAALAVQTLALDSLGRLTSVEVLSGCAALHTLELSYLSSLTSVEGLSGCALLRSLEFSETSSYSSMDKLSSLPDLSGLSEISVKYDKCQPRLKALLRAWIEGVRKT